MHEQLSLILAHAPEDYFGVDLDQTGRGSASSYKWKSHLQRLSSSVDQQTSRHMFFLWEWQKGTQARPSPGLGS